jgi:hypothetical protein
VTISAANCARTSCRRFGEPITPDVGSVCGDSLRVVEVFVGREAAVAGLPREIGQRELCVQSMAGVAQALVDDRLKPEAFVQFADRIRPISEVARDP